MLRKIAVKLENHDNSILWNEEQEQEDNGDKVVESGQEASDDALMDGVGNLN